MAAMVWLHAARPKTLVAAVAPVAVGTAIAVQDGAFQAEPALWCLAVALLIQIGTNFANDYFDWVRGADTPERRGPTRYTAAGLIAPGRMRAAALVAFALAFVAGLNLLPFGGWPLIALGVVCIVAGYCYTGGPYPLAYHGLGDVFVVVFFGLVAVGGTYFTQAGRVSAESLEAGLFVGLLANNLLVVNNCRDIPTDRKAGKRTLAVRFGDRFARRQYLGQSAAAVALVGWLAWRLGAGAAVALVVAPLLAVVAARLWHAQDGPVFNRLLGLSALALIIGSAALAAGVAFL